MRVPSIGSGAKAAGVSNKFPATRTPPDNWVEVPHSPGPERLFRLLFQRWNPRGKHRPGQATEDEVRSWIDGFLVDQTHPQTRALFHYQVRPLGWRLIGLLSRFSLRVKIMDDESYQQTNGSSRGVHISRYNVIELRHSALYDVGTLVATHEFGHAIDHLMSSLCTGGHQVSVKLWHWFRQHRRGFVTNYASKNPAEYLAESLEAYFCEGSYRSLQEKDPAMFTFVDDLITISNG